MYRLWKMQGHLPGGSNFQGEKYFVIDAETCVSCGQCVDECESDAISET